MGSSGHRYAHEVSNCGGYELCLGVFERTSLLSVTDQTDISAPAEKTSITGRFPIGDQQFVDFGEFHLLHYAALCL